MLIDIPRYVAEAEDQLDLLATVRHVKPHILFGVSTIGGLFTPEVRALVF